MNNSTDGEFEAANSRLNEGLKTCRSVVSNYKALLCPEQNLFVRPGEKDAGETPPSPPA